MDVAVLLLIWRRPIHVKKVINALRRVSPKKIYISSDGPIKDDLKNKELVESTRELVLKEIGFYKYKETKSGVEYAILRKQDKFSAKRGLKKTKPCNDLVF